MVVRSFWPAAETAQADYEQLREAVLAGVAIVGEAATRFARAGLAGLIARPASEPVFTGRLFSARRPAWSPYTDSRLEALAAGYGLLLVASDNHDGIEEVAQ